MSVSASVAVCMSLIEFIPLKTTLSCIKAHRQRFPTNVLPRQLGNPHSDVYLTQSTKLAQSVTVLLKHLQETKAKMEMSRGSACDEVEGVHQSSH